MGVWTLMIRKKNGRFVVEVYDAATRGKRYVGSTGKLKEARELEARAKLKRASLSAVTAGAFTDRWLREFRESEIAEWLRKRSA